VRPQRPQLVEDDHDAEAIGGEQPAVQVPNSIAQAADERIWARHGEVRATQHRPPRITRRVAGGKS